MAKERNAKKEVKKKAGFDDEGKESCQEGQERHPERLIGGPPLAVLTSHDTAPGIGNRSAARAD